MFTRTLLVVVALVVGLVSAYQTPAALETAILDAQLQAGAGTG